MTERRNFQRYNFDAFELNGFDNVSTVLQKFQNKSKRLSKIFNESDDELQEIAEQSHGLHLVSQVNDETRSDTLKTKGKTPSGKENEKKSTTNSIKSQVRALSPTEITVANAEEIIDPNINSQIKSSAINSHSKKVRSNISLRRSLFSQADLNKKPATDLICSTPMTNHRICRQESFFNIGDSRIPLSPIRKGAEPEKNEDVIDVIETPVNNNKETHKQQLREVESLAELENDLRAQYQIQEKTPSRNHRSRSHLSEQSPMKKDGTPTSHRSEPVYNRKQKRLKNCTVQVQPMEISQDIIKSYRKEQVSRLSVNQTDNVSINIMETPLNKRRLSVRCDSALAKKLRRCNSDSDMTDDDDIITNSSPRKLKHVEKPKKSSAVKLVKQQQNQLEVEFTDDEDEDVNMENDVNDVIKKIINSHEEDEIQVHNESPETVIFKKPTLPPPNQKLKPIVSVINTSIDASHVPSEIVESCRSLQKPSNESSTVSSISSSMRLSIPRGKQHKKKTHTPVQKYLNLTKNVKKQRYTGSKRTLYSQNISTDESMHNIVVGDDDDDDNTRMKETEINDLPEGANLSFNEEESSHAKEVNSQEPKRKRGRPKTVTNLYVDEEESSHVKEVNSQEPKRNRGRPKTVTTTIATTVHAQTLTNKENKEPEVTKRKNEKASKKRDNKRDHTPSESADELVEKKKKKYNRIRTDQNDNENGAVNSIPSESEPIEKKKKTYNRIQTAENDFDNDDENVVENSTNDDEGFHSDNSERNNIRYDPYERGCQRPGLRVRRYCRPWWVHDADSDKYGITYGTYKMKDARDEMKCKKMMAKHRVTKHQINMQAGVNFIPPEVMIKKIKEVGRKNRATSVEPKKRVKEQNAKTNNILPDIKENAVSDHASHVSSNTETLSLHTAYSRSDAVNKVFESFNNTETNSRSVTTDSYDMQQINKLEWTTCGTNIYFHQYINNKNDGFIKFMPGSAKSKAKTKNSVLKFVLLAGKIDFIVNDDVVTLENLGYISIKPGCAYSARNPYEQQAILSFIKLDSVDMPNSSSSASTSK